MTIQELIEIASLTTIVWKTETEPEEFITKLHANGYSEREIEKILYFMDNGSSAKSAMKLVRA